jgi:alpha-D-ribose 1-methylphosphonate 5-triphosphate diphosphatase
VKQTNALRLTGATILRAHELVRDDICISDGVITDGNGVDVNLSGYLVLPGIIDLHGDAFERHILPRPRAAFSMDQGLVSTDREAAANGITTAWMAQSWSWEGGHRSPDFAEAFLQALEVYRTRMQTDLRVQIRCETHTVETLARLIEMIRHHRVDYVIFNNHLDEMLQVLETSEDELAHWAKSVGRPVEVHRAMILDAADQKNKVPRYICALARAFD